MSQAARVVSHPVTLGLIFISVILIDWATAPYLIYPLIVLPVSLTAWFWGAPWAYGGAALLTVSRFATIKAIHSPVSMSYLMTNGLIGIGVLMLMAFLIGRAGRQTKDLEEQVAGFVTMCARSRTVEYEGEWITFELYLKRRFNLDTSHGISPAMAEKAVAELEAATRQPQRDS